MTGSKLGKEYVKAVYCHPAYLIHMQSVLVTQLFSTLRDPMDCSPASSSIHGIFQARILEWVAIHAEYLMQNASWKTHKLESQLTGEISIISSEMQMIPL